MMSVGDILAGLDSSFGQPSANVNTSEGVAQHATGRTNGSSNNVANNAVGSLNLKVAAGIIGVALLFLWVGGGVVFKGL